MGNKTNIQWCDATVNLNTGCQGCELWTSTRRSCYAGNLHEQRLSKSLPALYSADFTEVRMAPGRMAKAAGWSDLTGTDRPDKPWLNGMPRMIFVGDMGDIFSEAVTFEYLKAELIDVALSPKGRRHIWMVLTKRPSRMANFCDWLLADHGIAWPEHVWTGTSITGKASESRAEVLCYVHAPVKFLSVEPLIESVNFAVNLLGNFQLVICGGESGSNARPFDLAWARSIIAQCKAAGVPAFVKQLGSHPIGSHRERLAMFGERLEGDDATVRWKLRDGHGAEMGEWPADIRIREFPALTPSLGGTK